MKHSEGSRKFREYHEKLEELQDRLHQETGLLNLDKVLDVLLGCSSKCCFVINSNNLHIDDPCRCLDWLSHWMDRVESMKYLKAKRELG